MASRAVGAGGLIVLPTDTVYGIAARPDRPDAMQALFRAKARQKDAPVAVLVLDREQASSVGLLSGSGRRLADAFWPGPLTIVVPRAPGFHADLGGDAGTVGVRSPDHPVAQALLHLTGPLATTSANRSGEPTPPGIEDIARVFREAVEVYLDAGTVSGLPSTVVSVVSEHLRILRPGRVGKTEIHRALQVPPPN